MTASENRIVVFSAFMDVKSVALVMVKEGDRSCCDDRG